jgi:hypothetical protein
MLVYLTTLVSFSVGAGFFAGLETPVGASTGRGIFTATPNRPNSPATSG